MNLLLIANPVSGGDARPRIARAVACLQAAGAFVEVVLTNQRGDARRFAEAARSGRYDRVVATGGDGTLNEVANGLHGSAVPVAFLPLGTVNVFALEAGIPRELEAACRLVLEGVPRRISLGCIDDEVFLLMASAGWDAAAVAQLRPVLKRRIGRLAYGISALEVLLTRPPGTLEIRLPDGTRRSGYGVVVSNARCYGGRYVITPRASLLSDRLELCLLRRGGRLAMLAMALRLALHLPLRPPAAEFYSVDSVEIAGNGVPVQIDGDARGRLPARLACLPQALAVVLPAAIREENDG